MNSGWRSPRASLVAVAARQLVVAVVSRQHQELLEDLRRLRQRVEAAGLESRRHHEVARPFRSGAHQGRSFDLQKVALVERAAQRLGGAMAQRQVALHGGGAQVEVAVLEAQLLARFAVGAGLVADHERQGGAGAQYLEPLAADLDRAGGQLAVHHLRRAPAHGAAGGDAVLQLQVAHGGGERAGVGGAYVEHHLGHAVAVAQVDEGDAAVVADPRHPAVEGHLLARRGRAELAARRRALHLVHGAIYPGPAQAVRMLPYCSGGPTSDAAYRKCLFRVTGDRGSDQFVECDVECVGDPLQGADRPRLFPLSIADRYDAATWAAEARSPAFMPRYVRHTRMGFSPSAIRLTTSAGTHSSSGSSGVGCRPPILLS